MGPKIVSIVDDDASLRRALSSLLRSFGFFTVEFGSGEEFLESDLGATDCVICDVQMGAKSGIDVYHELQKEGVRTPFVFISAASVDEIRRRVAENVPIFKKPFDGEELVACVQALAA